MKINKSTTDSMAAMGAGLVSVLYSAIRFFVVREVYKRPQKAGTVDDDGFPVPSDEQPQEQPPMKFDSPELAKQYQTLREEYLRDPEHFRPVLEIVLSRYYATGVGIPVQSEQGDQRHDTVGPVPDSDSSDAVPVVAVPAAPPVPKIRKGWYFYVDGRLYDGFQSWNQINAAVTKLVKRGAKNISEIERMD